MLVPRNIEHVARKRLAASPCLIIEGARQVGKSTLAGYLAKPGAVVANLDHQATFDSAMADPQGFVEQAADRQLVIDEIQRLPELTLALKLAIDTRRDPGRFIVTGSSSLLRVRGTADSLAGRAARLQLFGLSAGEASRTFDDFAARVRREGLASLTRATSDITRQGYAELVSMGGYPEARGLQPDTRQAWFDDYVRAILGRDLREIRAIDSRRAMAILRTVAGRQSSELVAGKLASDTNIPATTVTRYLDLLQDVNLVHLLPPWTPNLSKREIGRQKAIVLDSGLAARLARMTAAQLGTFAYGEALGAFVEGLVVSELLKQQTWTDQPFELFHYRDRSGVEVDVVLEFEDGAVLALEVKSSTSFSRGQFAGMAALRDRVGERFLGGVVLNTSSSGYRFADRLVGAPVSALWASAPFATDIGVSKRADA